MSLVIGVAEHAIEFLHEAYVPAVALPRRVARRVDFVRAGQIGLQHGKMLRPPIRHRRMEAGLRQPHGSAPKRVANPQEGGAVGVGEEAAVGTHLEETVAIERIGAGIREHLHLAFAVCKPLFAGSVAVVL